MYFNLLLVLFYACTTLYSLPVKKYDEYAEYYEGEDVAENLANNVFQQPKQTQKSPDVSITRHLDSLASDIVQNKPTNMAFNLLNNFFNIGRNFLKPLGIDGQAKIVKQEDKDGGNHLEFQKQLDLFGFHAKDTDKVRMENGSPTYQNSKRIDFMGTQIGAADSNKQISINPAHAGFVNCDQYQLFGAVWNDCYKRNFDISAVPKFIQNSLDGLNLLGYFGKPTETRQIQENN